MVRLAIDPGSGVRRVRCDHPDGFRFLREFLAGFRCPDRHEGRPDDFVVRLDGRGWRIRWGGTERWVGEEDLLPAIDHELRRALLAWLPGWGLHAAAIGTEAAAILAAGRSGSGKSTLAVSWYAAGGAVWSDEIALLASSGKDILVRAWPRPWEISHDLGDPLLTAGLPGAVRFGYPLRAVDGVRMYASYWRPESWPAPAPIRFLLFLTGDDRPWRPVRDGERLVRDWLGEVLPGEYADRLADLPVWAGGRDRPSRMVRRLEALLAKYG